ncbi:MAG TPA: hypothetical protein ENG74_01420 [Thermoplasmatales archaeon]|nr:hypothetical protein [Thermoplasmatales archaeon]
MGKPPWEECKVVKLVNLTPHEVTVIKEDGEEVSIPPSGEVARVYPRQEIIGEINDIPVVQTVFEDIEGLPDPEECTVYIVSTLVLQALQGERDDVVAPDTGPESAVRDKEGRIVAVKRFQVI